MGLSRKAVRKGKDLLVRIVAMLMRRIERGNQVREGDDVDGYVNGYVNVNVNGDGGGGGGFSDP